MAAGITFWSGPGRPRWVVCRVEKRNGMRGATAGSDWELGGRLQRHKNGGKGRAGCEGQITRRRAGGA